MTKKLATIQYRYLKTHDLWDDFNLKDMVVDVLGRAPNLGGDPLSSLARLRKKDLDQDGSFVVLNKLSDEATWSGPFFAGQLIHVKSGTELPGISGSLEDDTKEFELKNLTLQERVQFVEGVLYFAIVDNHIGLIEGNRTRSRTLERYLTRLLQDAGELDAGNALIMNARLEGNAPKIKQMTVTPRKSRAVSGRDDIERSSQAAEEEGEGRTVLDVLRLLGWDEQELSQLQDSVPEGGWIEGTFKVLFKRKGGRSADVNRAVLEEALRHLDPRSVGLLGDGVSEKGGLIKLSDKRQIATDGDLLDPQDAMVQIINMIETWSKAGKIDCTF